MTRAGPWVCRWPWRWSGAEEVAGYTASTWMDSEPVGQSGDLPVAQVGNQAVVMAVDAAVEVPLGFRVADQVDLSHG